ncbi:MAG: tetratricopeptide repeat protein [Puniceicoccales bacterium]|jgi:tetratricopeptide (TPR) repeat protein|nr:tetratricopeptide repeat protein [Puniceicoccales bacterium]
MGMDPKMDAVYRKNLELLMERVEKIKKDLEKKGTLAQAVEIATEEKQSAYTLGYQFYQQQKYDKALIIFNALHMLDPLNKDFAKAQAATLQMSGNPFDAATQFLMAYFFHPEDLELALFAGKSMIQAGEFPQAYFILKNVLAAQKFPMTEENKKYCDIIRELLPTLKNKGDSMMDNYAKRKKTGGAPTVVKDPTANEAAAS